VILVAGRDAPGGQDRVDLALSLNEINIGNGRDQIGSAAFRGSADISVAVVSFEAPIGGVDVPLIVVWLIAIAASYGLAAVAETRGEKDEARRAYEKVFEFAQQAGFGAQARDAEQKILSLDERIEPVPLYDAETQPAAPMAGLLASEFTEPGRPSGAPGSGAAAPGPAPIAGPEFPPLPEDASPPDAEQTGADEPGPDEPGAGEPSEPDDQSP